MYEEEEENGLTVPSRVKEPSLLPSLFSVVCGTYCCEDLEIWFAADVLLMVTNDSFVPPFGVIPFAKMLS